MSSICSSVRYQESRQCTRYYLMLAVECPSWSRNENLCLGAFSGRTDHKECSLMPYSHPRRIALRLIWCDPGGTSLCIERMILKRGNVSNLVPLPSVSMYATWRHEHFLFHFMNIITFPDAPPSSGGNWATTLIVWASCVFPVLNSPYTGTMVQSIGQFYKTLAFGEWLRHDPAYLSM